MDLLKKKQIHNRIPKYILSKYYNLLKKGVPFIFKQLPYTLKIVLL